ncbi:LysM peptidoglycan-binding domain-containing protein [Legionella nagasakiensis]|uniref:LysM peptidoglycan-binding domain-containing protein n=1 Tax=Legionella nagasakiensis TaxID=535290 RepID=UPI001056D3B7|nr:LysM peptidoglycan-binding domain-containing protein [Legionella nagasakiensis]
MRYMMFFLSLILSVSAQALTLRSDAPAQYVVQSGDTLWDIANRYLPHPWEWKSLWHANPQIKNPDRLYPGAVLELHYHQQNPYLKVLSNGTIKLSPYMRPMPLEDAIPPIPLSDIRPFLDASLVLDKDSLVNAPYIIAFTTEHLLGGQGDEVYVKNLCPPVPRPGTTFSYGIYRPCGEYIDPTTKCFLGYKAILVGYAELVKGGDPATILLTDIMQGVELKDRVMPNNHPEFAISFEPKAPNHSVHGAIIDLPGDYSQGAAGLVVVLNRGKDAGLQEGDVLGVFSEGKMVSDPKCPPQCVQLPPERIGEVMIFRTFTHTSFALVVRSIRAVKPMDTVTNP